jgi:membrane associated rhomboid family serine protease
LDQQREPLFRGPWPVWTLAGVILLSYAIQSFTLDIATAARIYGMTPSELGDGRWGTVFTALFIHGSWAHVGMNAVGALAFGTPVARYLGLGARGVLGFFLLYIVCGLAANLGYAALHLQDDMPLAGASGAVSGLFGAASRLIEHRPGLSPVSTRTVIASAAAWVVINVVLGLMHYAPGIGEVQVAWEAHIAGYFAGVVLIAPFASLFRKEPPPVAEELTDQSDI